jgi:hypothetical protein
MRFVNFTQRTAPGKARKAPRLIHADWDVAIVLLTYVAWASP